MSTLAVNSKRLAGVMAMTALGALWTTRGSPTFLYTGK